MRAASRSMTWGAEPVEPGGSVDEGRWRGGRLLVSGFGKDGRRRPDRRRARRRSRSRCPSVVRIDAATRRRPHRRVARRHADREPPGRMVASTSAVAIAAVTTTRKSPIRAFRAEALGSAVPAVASFGCIVSGSPLHRRPAGPGSTSVLSAPFFSCRGPRTNSPMVPFALERRHERIRLRRPGRHPPERQGEDRADVDRPPGEADEVVRDAPRTDDRVAPVVELDELGQELRAHPVAVAHGSGRPGGSSARARGRRPPAAPGVIARQLPGEPATQQRARAAWRTNSSPKTRRALASRPTAPSGMPARAATGELAAPALDPGEVVRRGRARGEALGRVGDRPEPEDARTALGGALAGHVAHDPGRRGHAARARRRGTRRRRSRTTGRRRAARPDRGPGPTPRPVVAQAAEVAAERARPRRGPVRRRPSRPTSPTVVPSSISRTPGFGHAADGHAGRSRASSPRPAERYQSSPAARDEGGVGEALDVLDERRPAADAALERPRRGGRGPRVGLVDEVDGGRFLAGDVAIRSRDDPRRHGQRRATLRRGPPSIDVARRHVGRADVQDHLVGARPPRPRAGPRRGRDAAGGS